MTFQDLGSVAELIGSIGVVVSLAYLAIQVRQNTTLLRMAATQNLVTANIDINRDIAGNKELSELIQKAMRKGFDGLTG